MKYDHKAIDQKWQQRWMEAGVFTMDPQSAKEKFYCLIEFPYPSGAGLHMGHPRSYTALDVLARKRRMQGYNVLYPIGWDAFGLPTENYAIKTGRKPQEVTKENIDTFRRQLQSLGISFDWSREVNTTDPGYYKWTQWMFLEFFKEGLAYKKGMAINWCVDCKIGLANEEVVNGACERCGGTVEKRDKEQWMIAITKYADRLLEDLDTVNYLPKIAKQQKDWIGRSEGAEVKFAIYNSQSTINVFTTRPDTLFGATYMVLAPEHPLIGKLADRIANIRDVEAYQKKAAAKSDIERGDDTKKKTGVVLEGIEAINPVNGEKIPVWVADYVMMGYGTGAIMAVPAHDERDFAFARKFDLPIKEVTAGHYLSDQRFKESVFDRAGCFGDEEIGYGREDGVSIVGLGQGYALQGTNADLLKEAVKRYIKTGIKVTFSLYKGELPRTGVEVVANSEFLDGLSSIQAKAKMIEWLEKEGKGEKKVNYRLRDWVFSRQRYWGEPIPLIKCEGACGEDTDGWVPVPVDQLPVTLPEVERYEPTDDGESPLAAIEDWVNTECPDCGGPAKRETDTMPNWAGSSWYFLRYIDPHNTEAFADPELLKTWMPVDWYNGGMEHTTLHLLYSRFWNKVLFDRGHVPVAEPYAKRTSHGLVLAEDGTKMSKSKGNGVNPDDVVAEFGADALRLYQMFLGPFGEPAPWKSQGVVGVRRFLEKVVALVEKDDVETPESVTRELHKLIKKVGDDIDTLKFNTSVAAMMQFVNLANTEGISNADKKTFLQLLNVFAPHIAEECWEKLGESSLVFSADWPVYDEALAKDDVVVLGVQVNGKVRGEVEISPDASEDEARAAAEANEKVASYLEGREVKKFIYVPGRIISFVI